MDSDDDVGVIARADDLGNGYFGNVDYELGSACIAKVRGFNRAEDMYNITNPLKGLKKPRSKPRLDSLSKEDEKAIYAATEPCFKRAPFEERQRLQHRLRTAKLKEHFV